GRPAGGLTTDHGGVVVTASLVVENREGLLRTSAVRLFDPGPERFRRTLLRDAEPVVVVQLEDLGHEPHAHTVTLTELSVHAHSHRSRPLLDRSVANGVVQGP